MGGLAHLGRSTSSFYADIRNLKIFMYNVLKKFSNSAEVKILHLSITLVRSKHTNIKMNCYMCMCIYIWVYIHRSLSRIFKSSISCNSYKDSRVLHSMKSRILENNLQGRERKRYIFYYEEWYLEKNTIRNSLFFPIDFAFILAFFLIFHK